MNISTELMESLGQIHWLSSIGQSTHPTFDFRVSYLETRKEALDSLLSNSWNDIKTEAQGDLTGYLAAYQPQAYGGHWNQMVKQSRMLVEGVVAAKIEEALDNSGFRPTLLQPILVDVNRAVIELSYRKKFSNVPCFFEHLLNLYQTGHLPCGWSCSPSEWPNGNLIAF